MKICICGHGEKEHESDSQWDRESGDEWYMTWCLIEGCKCGEYTNG